MQARTEEPQMEAGLDDLVDLDTARRHIIPRRHGRCISDSSVTRWHRVGIYGVRLRVVYVGATPYTSRRMVQQFVDAVTAARQPAPSGPAVIRATDAQLREAGLR